MLSLFLLLPDSPVFAACRLVEHPDVSEITRRNVNKNMALLFIHKPPSN
jgi:hypothetical protein